MFEAGEKAAQERGVSNDVLTARGTQPHKLHKDVPGRARTVGSHGEGGGTYHDRRLSIVEARPSAILSLRIIGIEARPLGSSALAIRVIKQTGTSGEPLLPSCTSRTESLR